MNKPVRNGQRTGLRHFKPYPAYKASGVEWLGKVPAHWEVARSKRLFALRKTKAIEGESQLTASQEYGVIPQDEFMAREGRKVVQVVTGADILKHVEPNDFVISMRSFQGGIEWSRQAGAISSAYVVLIPSASVDHPYFSYLLKSKRYIQALQSTSNLVRDGQALRLENFSLVDLPVLPPSEQSAIAGYLDRETSRIDTLIAKNERLIELLQEKRTALISHAVTKGLDPDAPMKDSGVEWLGEVPAHWEAVKLKRVCRIRYGLGQPPAESPDGVPLVRATNISSGRIVDQGMMYVDPDEVPSSRDAFLELDDILVVRSGAYAGDSAIVPKEYAGSIAGYDMVVSVKMCSASFIAWQLLSYHVRWLQFEFHRLRAAQPHLNAEELGSTLLCLPRLSEQISITAFLDHETAHVDGLIEKVRQGIDRLKEYRSALISAAVTGQIDVREEVAA